MTSSSSDVMRCAEFAMAEELAGEDMAAAAAGFGLHDFSDGQHHGDIRVMPPDVTNAGAAVTPPIGSSTSTSSSVITDEDACSSSTPKSSRKSCKDDTLTSVSSSMMTTSGDEAPPRCGWCCWKPDYFQSIYNYKTALLLMCCFAFLQGVVVNGFTPLNTGSLERRFGLTSVETGWLNSAYDLAAATATVFLSYLADRRHKPRWLMFSAICFTIGSLIFALPHFIAAPYVGSVSQTPLCFAKSPPSPVADYINTLLTTTTTATNTTGKTSSSPQQLSSLVDSLKTPTKQCEAGSESAATTSPASYWQQVLLAGQIIMGVGGAVIYTVGVAFIDDFSEPTSSGLHIGLTFLSTAVGAAAGYGIGSALLTLGVNFNRPDWPQFERYSTDPNYVGAWWLGYLFCSGLFAAVALGFSCFDYEMPETALLKAKRISETHAVKFSVQVNGQSRILRAIVDFLNTLLKLVTNPVLVCVTLALVSHALFSQGTQPFFVKIIENQFHVSESKAGFIVGAIIIIGISSATIASGYLMKRLELTVRGTLLMITIFVFLSCCFSLCLLMHCDQERIVGINVAYDKFGRNVGDESSIDLTSSLAGMAQENTVRRDFSLKASCNAACNCSEIAYRPVCHRGTETQFFSACHAGCRGIKRLSPNDPFPVYTNCSCLEVRPDLMALNANNPAMYSLHPGICEITCPQFYPAMILMFMLLFCGFFTTVPLTGVVMRCVRDEDRSMALAFNQSVERFLGNIPGPLLIGRIIDLTCIFRREYCDSSTQGACFTYDSKSLAVRLTTLCVGLNSCAFLLYLLAFLLYKPPSGQTVSEYFVELWERRKNNAKKTSSQGTIVTSSSSSTTFSNINQAPSEITLVAGSSPPSKDHHHRCLEKGLPFNGPVKLHSSNDTTEQHLNAAYSRSSLNDFVQPTTEML